ncbi:MAG: transglutaminase family protein [Pirellulales bacterium]
MSIHVALHHRTEYRYGEQAGLGPQVIRLRPAAHCRTRILSYSLKVDPAEHFLNWQQDPYGNFLARVVVPRPTHSFTVSVDLTAEMTVINPFDFFLEPVAEYYPFVYSPDMLSDLMPFLHVAPAMEGSPLANYVRKIDRSRRKTIDFLVELNQQLQCEISYLIRLEPGVQSCDETLEKRSGSCRDSAWLLVNVLRRMGLAARFVSGYIIQLKPDKLPLEGPVGAAADFTDLHAWTEVYLPGAGWVGLDPTSGLLAGEGHIPLACTPEPISAAPITGSASHRADHFDFQMTLTRIHEDARVTKPYTEEQWGAIRAAGVHVDDELKTGDVRLTMGGEPTFVSIDDMEGAEWKTEAMGPHKRELAGDLLMRLKRRFAPQGLLHFGQGKWYPGESLPRWALRCYWRNDGQPLWQDESLFADPVKKGTATIDDARRFGQRLAEKLGVRSEHVIDAYEDVFYYAWKERRLPANVNLRDSKLENEEERVRLARVFEQGLTSPVGCTLPLRRVWWTPQPYWESGDWVVRSEAMFLIPGDSPMGYRLPIQSLLYEKQSQLDRLGYARDAFADRPALPLYQQLRERATSYAPTVTRQFAGEPARAAVGSGGSEYGFDSGGGLGDFQHAQDSGGHHDQNGGNGYGRLPYDAISQAAGAPTSATTSPSSTDPSHVVRTALCIEPRDGVLHIFMPPIDRLEDYLELVTAIEATASELASPVVIEGYEPPHDPRLSHLKVTPDPGVIEVNVPPARDWDELVAITTGVYEDAHFSRLGTEKFDIDGTHTGTGGGNHVVLGGPTPADSPFLRRPDLLRSLVAFWHNHPSLSYLLSGTFIGPTSQAPRVDEGRRDARYELEIAFEQAKRGIVHPPWLVDRVFRHLLVDGTGNTHRAEFCIDKLYSPDSSSGRLGLVEFRAFEMPPHERMSLTQQLLLRACVAKFWKTSYTEKLVDWDTSLHDRFMLPHFVWQDFRDVIEELVLSGYALDAQWFAPHFEFRFPFIGDFAYSNVQVEIRKAIEPWYVLGEEGVIGGTARYVDSSVERLQVLVRGLTDARHTITCNGRKLPLHRTGVEGEYVAGVRYRAWQPPSCLHPTIPVDTPLVFDVLDGWMKRSLGGAMYHVGHPGGLNPGTFPVNAFEAESRRAARFLCMGHRGGPLEVPTDEVNRDYPLTLDLRRGRT